MKLWKHIEEAIRYFVSGLVAEAEANSDFLAGLASGVIGANIGMAIGKAIGIL